MPRSSPAIPAGWYLQASRELASAWQRLRRLLLRCKAPQPCSAHRERGLTRPQRTAPIWVRQTYAKDAPQVADPLVDAGGWPPNK
jgi:hypothetical protein